jgi:hypothetical protein
MLHPAADRLDLGKNWFNLLFPFASVERSHGRADVFEKMSQRGELTSPRKR